MIVGITGYKRHGKDTVAQIVVEATRRSGRTAKRIALADPLKRIARDLYGLSEAHTDGDLKEEYLPEWGKTARQIMQLLGTEVARSIHPDTWVRYLIAQTRQEPSTLWVVPDIRFPNEAAALRAEGAVLWRVHRPALNGSTFDPHPSEAHIASLPVDAQLTNDTIAELRAQVLALMGVS